MRVAVLGASGQLGTALRRKLGSEAISWGRPRVALEDAESLRCALTTDRPDVVINAAAWNLVDLAEDDPASAFAVNAFGVRELAIACATAKVPLMHISTDYVFGLDAARSVPYLETCMPGPLNVYGTSKLAGEYFVRTCCPGSFVIRTCGLYGLAEGVGKGNFIQTMLSLGQSRRELHVVNDQHCTPTSAADLAEMLLQLLASHRPGLYHVTNSGETTWFDLAVKVFALAGLDIDVRPISTAMYGRKAWRPSYSVLDTGAFTEVTGKTPRDWENAVADYIQELQMQ